MVAKDRLMWHFSMWLEQRTSNTLRESRLSDYVKAKFPIPVWRMDKVQEQVEQGQLDWPNGSQMNFFFAID